MSRTLFKINKRGTVVLHPEVSKLHTPFRKLSEKETLFMIIYCDHFGLFRQFPTEEKLKRTSHHVFGVTRYEPSDHLIKCMETYMDFQYNEKEEMVKALKRRLIDIRIEIASSNTKITTITSLINAARSIDEEISKYESEISDNEDYIEIEGGKTESLLEFMQRNKKLSEIKRESYPEIKILHQPIETGEDTRDEFIKQDVNNRNNRTADN